MTRGSQPDREAALGLVRGVLARLVQDGTAVADSDGSVHRLFPIAVGPAEGAAIRSRVIREHATQTIEIGLGYGIAALYACEGLLTVGGPGARHVVIDPHQQTRFAGCGLQVLSEAGVAGLIEYHAEESQAALPRLLAEARRYDLAVVDGNHRFDAVFVDLYYLGRLLRPGGIVFLDDYHLPGVARAASFFLTNLNWALEETSTTDDRHHWAVLRTRTKPDTRPFDYLADF
jgi:predicted O-methyltransferase YrrM